MARERPELPLTRELSAKLTEGEKKHKKPIKAHEKHTFSLPQSKIGSEEPIFASPLVRGG